MLNHYEEATRRPSHTETYSAASTANASNGAPSPAQQLSSASSYADMNFLLGAHDPAIAVPKPNRNRRRSTQGHDHTKHRRTRSGCYTCRSRRVKCDENHPICERCRKGSRECVYPESSASSKSPSSGSSKRSQKSSRESPGSSSDEYEEGPEHSLEPIPDEDELRDGPELSQDSNLPRAGQTATQLSSTRNSSETPSLVQDKASSPTPSSEGSTGYSTYQTLADSRLLRQSCFNTCDKSDWMLLPDDVQLLLTYFQDNISHLHYSLKYDADDFMRTRYLDIALQNEALLYAVVGFAAFQRALHAPHAKIQDFLQYYNKSVSLLLRSLRRGEKHSHGTILAMLQLATIEEYLGDWINLLGHQKAAYQILLELYTPQTIMENGMNRLILVWYMRFDVYAGFMGGFQTVLSRDWFLSAFSFFQQMSKMEPESIRWKIEIVLSQHRLLATDMSLLFARIGKGEISMKQFQDENAQLSIRIQEWKTKIDPVLCDVRYSVRDFTGAPPQDPNDIVDPYMPGILYSGPLRAMNIASIDWHSINLMHQYQTCLITQTIPGIEIARAAYKSCQLFEAMELWPGSPPGTIVATQAGLGIAVLFLPRDERHFNWARRKLALIESQGYIYSSVFRSKIADLFKDPSCMHWWLPNDEALPPIIRNIRNFVTERSSRPKDMATEDVGNMKGIFEKLNLDDEKSTPSATSTGKQMPRGNTQVATGVVEDCGFGYNEQQGLWGSDDQQGGGPYGY